MENKRISIGEALSFGWDKFKGNAAFLIVLMIAVGVVYFILNLIQRGAFGQSYAFGILIYIINFFISAFISMGLIRIYFKVVDAKERGFNDFMEAMPYFSKYLIAYILFVLATAVGTFLLIIPGIYLFVKLFFGLFIVIDKDSDGIEALKKSYEITTGSFWDLLLFFVVIGIINLIGAIPMGLGLLVTMPVTSLAAVYVYRQFESKDSMQVV